MSARKLGRIQFKLWHLLLLMSLFGIVLAWFVGWHQHATRQRQVLSNFDCTVWYQYQLNPNGACIPENDAPPPGPYWMRRWLGDDFFAKVVFLSVHGVSEHKSELEIESFNELGQLESLRELTISWGPDFRRLDGIENLKRLESLSVSPCERIDDFSQLAELTQLKDLTLFGCNNLDDLPFKNLHRLEHLCLGNCPKLNDLHQLAALPNLTELDLSHGDLVDLSTIGKRSNLKLLNLFCARVRTNIKGVENLQSLSRLNLACCDSLESIDEISKLKELEELCLSGCRSLVDFSALSNLPKLKSLDLSYCDGLINLNWISNLEQLETLNISGCNELRDWQMLLQLKQLKRIEITGARHITKEEAAKLQKQLKNSKVIGFWG